MPPRHAYWTILVDDQPTAFRAHDPEELLPTLNRLREKHPSAAMKWFERGKLWESRDAAREAGLGQGERRWEGPRPDRSADAERPPRDRSWRPGGDHRDPRQKYKDAKKAKWGRFKQNIRERADRRAAAGPPSDPQKFSPPHGDPLREKIDEPGARRPPAGPAGRPDRRDLRPSGSGGQRGGWKPTGPARGPGWKPQGPPRAERPPQNRDRGGWQGREPTGGDWRDRPPRDRERPRGEWDDRPPRDRNGGWDGGRDSRPAAAPKPRTSKPWGAKPVGTGSKKPWGTKPGGTGSKKPWGTKPGGTDSKKPWGTNPGGGSARKSWGGKPAGPGARKPWGAKPGGSARPKTGAKTSYRGPGRPGGGKGPHGPRKPRGE